MSRRVFGRLADFKGGELLAQLKAQGASRPPNPAATKPPAVAHDAAPTPPLRSPKPHLTPDAQRAQRYIKKTKAAAAKAKKIITIRPRNAAERALYLQAQQSSAPQATVVQPSPTATIPDSGEAAFRRLLPMRQALDGFVANHQGSAQISSRDREQLCRRLRAGADQASSIVDQVDGYFLGYDFGTSTTKVVARNPYARGGIDEAFAIDVPVSVPSDQQPHLFPTAVYWNQELDHFSLLPGDGYALLDSFKSALIQGCGHRMCNGLSVTMAEAATAFIALHLAYCIGAGLDAVPAFKINAINAGIPVAVFDGQANVGEFDLTFRAATHLIAKAPTLSLHDVKMVRSEDPSAAVPFERYAELAGAIAGYCSATRHYLGGHMIIDCGSATLDIVTFDLNQRTHRPIGIYGASVENLGADACKLFVKKGATADDCRAAIRFEEHLVYKQTIKQKPNLFCLDEGKYPYQIILLGGGIQSDIHAEVLSKLANAFAKPFHKPEIAPTLRRDKDCAPARLILADGLARDPIELKEILLPKPPTLPVWSDPVAPGKEQV